MAISVKTHATAQGKVARRKTAGPSSMPTQVVHVDAPAIDDSGWLVRTLEKRGGIVSEQLHWYEDEATAETAYRLFLQRCALVASGA